MNGLVRSAALEYCGLGWPVFPLNGKVPLAASHGYKDASSDPSLIAHWPDCTGVGIATGDGLVVLDVDGDDGAESLDGLEREHGKLPDTVLAVTGAGGRHHYFASRARIRNSAGRLGPGLDVRGEGGHAAAPPSIHPDTGLPYWWGRPPDRTELAPLPGWLERLAVDHHDGRRARPPSEWAALVHGGVPEGRRNDAVARLAGRLLARGIGADETFGWLLRWNRGGGCRPPLPEDELARVVVSIAEREARKWR